jgi:hypothetical protein
MIPFRSLSVRASLVAISLVVLFIAVFLLPSRTFAQSRAAVKSSKKATKLKRKSARQLEQERERERNRFRYDEARNQRAQRGPTVKLKTEFHGVSEPLSELARRKQPALARDKGPVFEEKAEELFEVPQAARASEELPQDNVQIVTGPAFAATVTANFDGVTASGSAPPDTTMAVGPNHIIVWVNSRFAIYNKSGTVITAATNGNTLFAGMPNQCSTTNRGDPILKYDQLADRWILSQFAFDKSGNSNIAPYFQCIAVSTTNDPTGTYYRYSVQFQSTSPDGFNDYGKLGIWPDAYYTSYNIFGGTPAGSNTGVALCASDRAKMIAGDATATTLCAPTAFYAGGGSFLPADLDGTTLPTVTSQGGIFIRQNTSPSLHLIKLKPNFVAGTLTLTDGLGGATGSTVSVILPPTTRPCNGSGGTCVAQPGTTNLLDTVGGRLMYRAAYRNRGGVESLVVAQGVDVDDAGPRSSAMRWYEIRNPFAAAPTLYQVGTFDEGGAGDRWMGSIAMNKNGDMMMGYSIVNAATLLKPSIALTGRRLNDPLNTMQTENIAFTGSGVQTGTLTRWGDYTTMSVDPADDESFCYVGQYLPGDGTFNWRTRVICAKFPAAPTAASVSVSGRVLGGRSRPLGVSRVTITDSMGKSVSTATDASGAYSFEDLEAGATYTITVLNRRYTFEPKVVTLTDNLTDVNFVATSR